MMRIMKVRTRLVIMIRVSKPERKEEFNTQKYQHENIDKQTISYGFGAALSALKHVLVW